LRQALVDQVQGGYPRRVAVGLTRSAHDAPRGAASSQHRSPIRMCSQTSSAGVSQNRSRSRLILSVLSSFRARVLPRNLTVFGELG
jgi:predicted ATP-dependent serine protease